jgi:hypothetical protein
MYRSSLFSIANILIKPPSEDEGGVGGLVGGLVGWWGKYVCITSRDF